MPVKSIEVKKQKIFYISSSGRNNNSLWLGDEIHLDLSTQESNPLLFLLHLCFHSFLRIVDRISLGRTMEFNCSIASLRSKNNPCISHWDSKRIGELGAREREEMKTLIDRMGILSAKAQLLKVPITTFDRIRFGPHRLYLSTRPDTQKSGTILVMGILKVGQKDLFIRRNNGDIREVSPLCVLDFYVHESCQRTGLGRQLFASMLSRENKLAHHLGYDRPSPKLLSFLAKHYQLSKHVSQANKFVVFDAYFEDPSEISRKINSFGMKESPHWICPLSFMEVNIMNKKEEKHGRATGSLVNSEAENISPLIHAISHQGDQDTINKNDFKESDFFFPPIHQEGQENQSHNESSQYKSRIIPGSLHFTGHLAETVSNVSYSNANTEEHFSRGALNINSNQASSSPEISSRKAQEVHYQKYIPISTSRSKDKFIETAAETYNASKLPHLKEVCTSENENRTALSINGRDEKEKNNLLEQQEQKQLSSLRMKQSKTTEILNSSSALRSGGLLPACGTDRLRVQDDSRILSRHINTEANLPLHEELSGDNSLPDTGKNKNSGSSKVSRDCSKYEQEQQYLTASKLHNSTTMLRFLSISNRPKSPRSCHYAQLSGFEAAATLGCTNGVSFKGSI